MDIFSLLMQIAIFIVFITAYFVIFGEKSKKKNNHYSLPGWNHFLKKWCAKCVVNKWKDSNEPLVIAEKTEEPRYFTQEESWDSHSFFGVDSNGTHFQVAIKVRKHGVAETILKLQMEDGTVYQMPGYPDTVVGRISKKSWNAGGLRFTLVEPFKKWRVTFNGFLEKYSRHDASQEAKEVIHVRFSLIWVTCSPPFRFPEDWSTEMIIESMACEPWTNQDWVNMSHQWEYGNYYQYGSLQGEMYVGQDLKPVLLRLRGVRDHSWAPYGCKPLNRTLHLFGTSSDGYLYNINVISFISGLTHAISGSIRCPNGVIESLTSCDLNLSDFAEVETEIPKSFSFVFTGIRSYKLILDMNINRQSKFMSGQPWNFVTRSVPTEFGLNGSHGYGFINLQYPYNGKSSAKVSLTNILEWYPLNRADAGFTCANFNETTACCPELVGAKGASLSLLSSVKSEDYKVPPGFCLTTKAFDDHLSANPELSKIIAEIHELNENYNEAKLKEQCYKATQLFNGTSVTGNIASMIKIYLDELQALVFSSNIVFDITYAVRSSGIGEDSEELSAAGQNETILGCRDITDILKGIQRCWGSLFSYHSVQYRRLHGQPVNCGMGVVVQVIIPAQAAGVMFTRHPNNGDPSTILITSNYGLGESVVSGQIEPDTILLNRDIDNRLSVREIIIGKKTHRINVNKEESADQLTESVALTAEEIASSSISEAISLRLGSIAVNQERLWGAPRDIEWALHNDTIYLVQARPITTLNPWTEYELLHEFDSPIMSDEDILSFANTGEVLPGYLSPLTISTVCSTLQNGVKILSGRSPSDGYNTQEMFTISHCRFGLNMYNSVYLKVPEKIDISVRVMEIGVCGHPVIDDRIHSTALRRNRPTTMDRIINLFIFIKAIFGSGGALEKAEVISKNFDLGEEAYESATDLLTALEESVEKLTQVVIYHNATTSASLFGQIIAMSILVENNKDLTIEHYTDIGRMLSSCSNVISAEVPIGLAEIVDTILNADNADAFCEQTPENGLAWLETNNKKAFNKLTTFLLKHRHRNIKEFDLATKTWGLDPSILIKSLQSVVAAGAPTKKREKTETSSAAVVAKLESPKKGITRFLLRLILPLCQKSVAHREGTKDQTILAIHKIRLAFLRLGKLMVRDWMLPDIDLVFFFTMYELRTYLKTRNSSFLNKAVQRRKFYPKWNALQFPETNEGYLEPLKKDDSRVTYHPSGNSMRIVGTPVTAGSIVGRACVVHNLSEIDQLKGGDILITHSTDIGWSPYFPLLGGVVTELGGLISHGAVIAREYGLPCIVGAQGAMSFFKTGDIILLAGTTGILEKVDPVEPKVVESNV